MIRPPNAWNRKPEKKIESANKCKNSHPGENNYLCLMGTAYSDFPPQNSPKYQKVTIPVLILTVEGDKVQSISNPWS